MRILIIPDVHGRDFWKEPCSHADEYDKIVFLGDYHDPYPFQVTQDESFENLKLLVNFVKEHRDKCVCLFGNHDGNYLVGHMADRVDYLKQDQVTKLLEELNLQLVYQVDNYLFSHSGVLPKWLEINMLTLEDLNTLKFNDQSLMDISPYRGGWDEVGSCVWGDVREYAKSEHIPNLYQIFGHTQLEKPVIAEDYACLDCRKTFELDTTKEMPNEGAIRSCKK